MLPIEIDNDYEGSTADISLEEDRLVIDISFEASDNGGLSDDADHESEELESPESPDPEDQIGSESRSMTYYDDRNNDDWRNCDLNNNEENNKTEDEVIESSEEETEASSEEWDSDSEAIRDSDGGYEFSQDDLNIDDDSNSEVIGYNDGDDESEGMSGSEDDVDENSEEDEIEEPIKCKVESELNRDSSDEEESEKVGQILTRFFKAARKKAKASPKKNDTSDKDAFDKSSATVTLEMLYATQNKLLAARISLIRRENIMLYELLADAELRHKRKRKRKEIVAEKQQYNSKHVKRKKRK
ncbi:dentin sialophosphoprotein-like [Cloeon dipterum]|uniref:dentin sialophosphoprotein-like n=1 Tax=Cloeon dipterum TaxID=197152 RepID=UPI00321FCD4E